MTCIQCAQIKTHRNGKPMFKQGFSGCEKAPVWEYFSYSKERECADFSPADAAAMEKRKGVM